MNVDILKITGAFPEQFSSKTNGILEIDLIYNPLSTKEREFFSTFSVEDGN